ncbi:RHS repeat domain-containing protein [Pelomonas sp. Root1444]|uniref:RHS repeat domain-containing protein n=1 Tax=Pelomonas sp. Root1444 TaxID=1736464 RepID=UPI0009E8A7F3|nr:RHS repeat domain-containing protein [Pelomonas sp. Root1444]
MRYPAHVGLDLKNLLQFYQLALVGDQYFYRKPFMASVGEIQMMTASTIRRGLLGVLLFAVAGLASAISLTVTPATSYDGSYAVNYSSAQSSQSTVTLYDNATNQAVASKSNSASGSFPFSGKAQGSYSYYVKDCFQPPTSSPPICSTSGSVNISVVLSAPTAPSFIKAGINQTIIVVNWAVTGGATSYQLSRNGALLTTLSSTGYSDLAAVSGTSYTYSVKACNAGSCSAALAATPVTAGAISTGVAVTENYVYDALGRLNTVKTNGNVKTDYRYDKAGNRSAVTE